MFGKSIHLFRLFGFPIRLDPSWFLIAALLTMSLARDLFPRAAPDLSRGSYWLMGVAGAVGLFASIVLHELGHAIVARRFEMPIREIVLFLFGGVARLEKEPPHARAEFFVAIGGPIVTVMLGFAFLAAGHLGWGSAGFQAVVDYLAVINLALLAFNLVPAFPLDGGRALRALLWGWRGDLARATRITATLGSAFGMVLIVLGVVAVLRGQFVAGIWWALLGLFLRHAARASEQQAIVRGMLAGEPIERFMNPNPVAVPSSVSLREVVDDYVYDKHHKMFPVVHEGRLIGCVTTRGIRRVPKDRWSTTTAAQAAEPCGADNTIEAGAESAEALTRMQRENVSRLMVTKDDQLVGIVSLKDLIGFLTLKLELEGAPS